MGWFKKKEEPVYVPQPIVKPVVVEQPPAELSVFDYPKSKYKVYWETHLFEHYEGPWVAEIRFIGYSGNDHRSNHIVNGLTQQEVQQKANKLIREKMEDYKWH